MRGFVVKIDKKKCVLFLRQNAPYRFKNSNQLNPISPGRYKKATISCIKGSK
jgi:hypothetical protein